MGQKTDPIGFRVGITKDWRAHWFSKNRYKNYILEDHNIRKYIRTKLSDGAISNIEINRVGSKLSVTVYTARPGMVFGAKRVVLESLKEELKKLTKNKDIYIAVEVIRLPELDSILVAQNIAKQIEERVSHRRAMKRAIMNALRLGALGIKVQVSGRLGGAEVARTEWYREGRVPLQTLKADIDYSKATAFTLYGTVGIKVWIYKGDVKPGNLVL